MQPKESESQPPGNLATSDWLSNASQHQPPVVAAGLPVDAVGQTPAVLLLVRPLDVREDVGVPVVADDAADEQVVLSPHALHGVLEQFGSMHVLVGGVADLVEESILHVARELLHDMSV